MIDLPRRMFTVSSTNWIGGKPPLQLLSSAGMYLAMKLRHGPTFSYGRIRRVFSLSNDVHEDSKDTEELLEIQLDKVDKGIAPGQFVAFYQRKGSKDLDQGQEEGFECLGAAVVSSIQEDSFHVGRNSDQDEFADVGINTYEVQAEDMFELL